MRISHGALDSIYAVAHEFESSFELIVDSIKQAFAKGETEAVFVSPRKQRKTRVRKFKRDKFGVLQVNTSIY